MGQIITNETDAIAVLELLCPSASDPTLLPTDMDALLVQTKRASLWEVSTPYALGVTLMPTVRNGRRYKLIAFDGSGVSSGTIEPSWPSPSSNPENFPVWSAFAPQGDGWWRNAIVSDGNLTWQEDGEDFDSLWDIQRAAFNGWMLKAGRAICAVDLQSGQMKQAQSQIYQHCCDMAQRYASAYVL